MRNSILILSKDIRIDKNYNNVLNYSEIEMLSYLREQGHFISEQNNYSFVDENQISIIVGLPYNDVYLCNYLAFQNPRYNGKWFFCFVDKIEYNSENSTKISFHTDIWHTWFSKLVLKSCYILREHTNNDTIGNNTIDEGLDVGEVICQSLVEDSTLNVSHYICLTTNWDVSSKLGFTEVACYNRNVWGSMIAVCPLTAEGIENLKYIIMQSNSDGHVEDLHDLFIVPSNLINSNLLETSYFDVYIGSDKVADDIPFTTIRTDSFSNTAYEYNQSITKNNSFVTYTPKNNKCFVYPYNYLLVTNNTGTQNIYKYELFSDSTCNFSIQLAMAIGCSGRVVPTNYKGISENIDEAIPLGKYPTCSWSSDSYINWLTQNAVNIKKDVVNIGFTGVKAVAGITGNILNLDIGGAIMSTVDSAQTLTNQIMDMEGNFYQAKLLPNLTGGVNDGDVNFASLDIGFKYMRMRCKDEYIKIIDNFFTRFGYKTLRVKIPNITSRKYWNYLQIGAGENLGYGDIPADSITIINQIAQKGVTIWHDHTQIGNYDLDNIILN